MKRNQNLKLRIDLYNEQLRLQNKKAEEDIKTQQALTIKAQKETEKIEQETMRNKVAWFRKHQWAAIIVGLICGCASAIPAIIQYSSQTKLDTAQYKEVHLTYEVDSLKRQLTGNKENSKDSYANIRTVEIRIITETGGSHPPVITSTTKSNINVDDCAQLCAKGHFSMRGVITVDNEADYKKWLETAYKISSFINSDINVSDDEIATYVNKNADLFNAEATRTIL